MNDPFAELLAMSGVREVLELRSRLGFMAYHGGALEEQTDVIAAAAAERTGASYYAVLQPDDVQWHIPSHRVSPAASTHLRAFIDHIHAAITIHGYGRRDHSRSVLLGGQNRELAHHVATHLRPRLPDFEFVTDLEAMPKDLRGLHPDNPVNLPPARGVQIELPPRVRAAQELVAEVVHGLVDAVTMWRPTREPTAR